MQQIVNSMTASGPIKLQENDLLGAAGKADRYLGSVSNRFDSGEIAFGISSRMQVCPERGKDLRALEI